MILEQFNLAGKVAIITGAGVGLGRGMALGLAEAGAEFGHIDILVNNAGIIRREDAF